MNQLWSKFNKLTGKDNQLRKETNDYEIRCSAITNDKNKKLSSPWNFKTKILKQNYGKASPNKKPPYGFLKSATEELQKI